MAVDGSKGDIMLDLNSFYNLIDNNATLICMRTGKTYYSKYYRYRNYKITVRQNKIDFDVQSITLIKIGENEA